MIVPRTRCDCCRSRGQTLVEFALVVPVLLTLLFGVVQVGFLLAGLNGQTQSVREAARYASTLPTPDTGVAGNCNMDGSNAKLVYNQLTDPASGKLKQYIAGYIPGNLVSGTGGLSNCSTWATLSSGTGVAYCSKANSDGTYSLRVRVVAVYRHPIFIPMIGRLISSTNTWTGLAVEEMRVEGPNRQNDGGFAACP